MGKYTIVLSGEQEKALLADVANIQEWINNAVMNKVRQCIDLVVLEYSDRQPKKLSEQQKLSIVRDASVVPVVEKPEN